MNEELKLQDSEGLKTRVLSLAGKLSNLVRGEYEPVDDPELSHAVAMSVKSYVDRLYSLRTLLNPVDRIIHTREQIQELQSELVREVAEVEDLSDSISDVDPDMLTELQNEIAAVKKDRKLYVSEEDEEDDEPVPDSGRARQPSLIELPVAERFRRILGSRFVDMPRLGEIFGRSFSSEDIAQTEAMLEKVWSSLFDRPQFRPHVEANRLNALRKAFRDYALLFRCAKIPAASIGDAEPCTMKLIREHFPTCFGKGSQRSLWYTRLPFYETPISRAHWALLDRQYLNCTFKRPSMRLLMYARANDLSPKSIRQKSVVEDVYDRVALQSAVGAPFFENCNSLTRTRYSNNGNGTGKQVFVYLKNDAIRVSGKGGTPHWRPSRPQWPGVLVSIVFD